MKSLDYLALLSNVSPHAPIDLDPLIFGAPPKPPQNTQKLPTHPPSQALWSGSEPRPSRIGIRVKTPLKDTPAIVTRLAAIAVERQIFPVILSHVGKNELQRFGFRVEQISGATDVERSFAEGQIKRFWDLAIIVDAEDMMNFG